MTEGADRAALRGARSVQVAAQAKVNLRLRILAREESGFHQIETIFLRLELADLVRVRRSTTRALDVSGAGDAAALGPMEQNLAWRAALAYTGAARGQSGFAIELVKRVPVGGGLGGGSADAGAVLRALDAMSPEPLGEAALLRLAATLGADVPFLSSESPCALGWGRGERLLPLPPPPPRDVVLLVPPFGVSTADAYGWLRTDATLQPGLDATMLDPAALTDWGGLAAVATNDFEPVVARRHPEVASLLETLRAASCAPAMMSGSGSVVFGILPAGADAACPAVSQPCTAMMTRTGMRVEPVSLLD